MTTIVIYPDNSACIDGRIQQDATELLRRYGISANRRGRGSPESAQQVNRDGVRLIVFPQPTSESTESISRALRSSEVLSAQRRRTLEQYRAVYAEYTRLRSTGMAHTDACEKLTELWACTARHINKIVAAQMRGSEQ